MGDKAVASIMSVPPNFKLRDWQTEALTRWAVSMRGVVEVTTGAGKTVFAALAMQLYFERFPAGHVVIAVPSTALQDQWFVELTEQFAVRPEHIALLGGGGRSTPSKKGAAISIGVANTLRTREIDIPPETFLVADECHRLGSAQNSRVLSLPHAASLGLSATPERDYDDGFSNFIEPQLGPIIYKYDYTQALEDGILSPFTLTNVEVPLLDDEARRYKMLTQRIARVLQRDPGGSKGLAFRRLLISRSRLSASAKSRIPVTVSIAMATDVQCIIFHEDTHSADVIARNLKSRGIFAVTYHSKISRPVRLDNLRLFRRGDARILVCCRALDEGLNVPNASVGIISSSTASTRQRIQRLGRVLRSSASKASAEVITLYATPTEKQRLEAEERSLLSVAHVRWRTATVGRPTQ